MKSESKLTSPISRVRGLGSAKDGVHHWWMLRLSSLLLVPLSLWFVVSLMTGLAGSNRVEVAAWLENPLVAVMLLGMLIAGFVHAKMGMEEVIEDYVHKESYKIAIKLINSLAFWSMGMLSLFAVIKLHFFGI